MWTDVALHGLTRIGWRPDCVLPQRLNIGSVLPPIDPKERIIFGTRSHMRDLSLGVENASYRSWLAEQPGGLHITSGAFFQHGLGYSATWEKTPQGAIQTDGWIHGYDTWSKQPPCAVLEGSVLHALRRVEDYLRKPRSTHPYPLYIAVTAGNQQVLEMFLKWANKGTLELASGMASDIVECIYRLASTLQCTLIMQDLPENFFQSATLTGMQSKDIIYTTAARINKDIGPSIWAQWDEQLARLPWTATETNDLHKAGYMTDEKTAILMLKETGSTACAIYSELRLTRNVIKEAFKALCSGRFQQVTLAGVICATRFKFYDENRKFPVRCRIRPDCTEMDSFDHLLNCARLTIPVGDEGEMLSFLVTMACRATVGNPGYPEPVRTVLPGEMEIEFPPSPNRSEGEISFDA